MDGLILKISSECEKDPANGSIYIFRNKKGDKLKALVYDENGFMMIYKRLCKKRFFTLHDNEETISMTPRQFQDLLSGIAVKLEPKNNGKRPSVFY